MDNSSTKDEVIGPQPIEEFRSLLESSTPDLNIPEVSTNRRITDLPFAVVLAAAVALLIPFFIWVFMSANFDEYIYGQGDINPDFQAITSDLKKSVGWMIGFVFIGITLTVIFLLLFRYFTAFTVWGFLGGSLGLLVVLTCILWYMRITKPKIDHVTGLEIVLTIVTVVLIAATIYLKNRINLVIDLFKEAIKVVFQIPLLFIEPFLTILGVVVAFVIFVYSMILTYMTYTFYAGNSEANQHISGFLIFCGVCNIIVYIWFTNFIIACQHMVISGAVSAVYFNKKDSAISNSFYNLGRFHLGTAAFGSLIMTLASLVRALIKALCNNKFLRCCVDTCFLQPIESLLKYITKNAYFITAMHGQPFIKSGKRAASLLTANALDSVAVNMIGSFVLTTAKICIVVTTTLIGVAVASTKDDIPNFYLAVLITVKIIILVAHCFFTVFETAVDTVFLCYCEENTRSLRLASPPTSESNLRIFIDNLKKSSKK